MKKEEDTNSWFSRLKHLLTIEPQTLEQLIALLRDAHLRSLIGGETLAIIESAILFAQMQVRDVMIPKSQMISISINASFEETIKVVTESGHSRFPVTDDHNEDIIGILHAKDLLHFQADTTNDNWDLNDLIRQAIFVPESKRLDLLLSEFKQHRIHMAMVVDEYGTIAGFITIEDIIEQIIGDIEDEFDIDEEMYIKSHGNHQYIIKAYMPVEEFNLFFNTTLSTSTYDTIGGLIMDQCKHLPKPGEIITIHGFELKIINADARRIKLIECIDKRPTHDA